MTRRVNRLRLLLPLAMVLTLAHGCTDRMGTTTDSVGQSPAGGQVSSTDLGRSRTGQSGTPAAPPSAPAESEAQATTALKKLGARFEQEPGLGGLFIDFGLILGNFPNDELRHLHAIPNLVAIRLPEGTTDSGLAHLKGLSQLKSLAVTGSNVSDAGLESLIGLSTLESVILWSHKVSDQGLNRLRQALPKCQVTLNR